MGTATATAPTSPTRVSTGSPRRRSRSRISRDGRSTLRAAERPGVPAERRAALLGLRRVAAERRLHLFGWSRGETNIIDTSCTAYPNGLCISQDGTALAVVEPSLPSVSLWLEAGGELRTLVHDPLRSAVQTTRHPGGGRPWHDEQRSRNEAPLAISSRTTGVRPAVTTRVARACP